MKAPILAALMSLSTINAFAADAGCEGNPALTGRCYMCKRGCGDRLGVILPLDAPTPRHWVERYPISPRPETIEDRLKMPVVEDLPAKLVELTEGGTFLRVLARSSEDEILHWGFDYLLKKHTHQGKAPHLAVMRGAQWSRDSRRDYKIVAGKFVERED